MKINSLNIFCILLLTISSCSNVQKHDIYTIDYKFISCNMIENNFIQIHDTNEIKQINMMICSRCSNIYNCPDNEYYVHRIFNNNPCIIVIIEDYYSRLYAIWDCMDWIELSCSGGDGTYSFQTYSYVSQDSLITYQITTEQLVDEYTDTSLDKHTITIERNKILLKGKTLPPVNKLFKSYCGQISSTHHYLFQDNFMTLQIKTE